MKKVILLAVIVLLLFTSFKPVIAQEYVDEDATTLFAKIYCLFQRKEPKWELESYGMFPNSFAIGWISRKGRASVSVEVFSSNVESREALKFKLGLMEREPEENVFPPPTRYSKVALSDFGEESYLINSSKYRKTDIMFRQGHYLIRVSGQTEKIARRFARHVADFLPPSNNSFNASGD